MVDLFILLEEYLLLTDFPYESNKGNTIIVRFWWILPKAYYLKQLFLIINIKHGEYQAVALRYIVPIRLVSTFLQRTAIHGRLMYVCMYMPCAGKIYIKLWVYYYYCTICHVY